MIPQNRAKRKLGVAVSWQPVDDAFFRLAELMRTSREAWPIYVTQQVLIDVEANCRGSRAPIIYGLLIGELCAEPKTGRAYILIENVMHAPACSHAGNAAVEIAANLKALSAEAARHGLVSLGWYHGGTSVRSAKARDDVAFHRSLFAEPWQVMLAFEEGERGTFVRVERSDARAYSAPFFELLPNGARANGGALRTVVTWENYQTLDSVVRLEIPQAPSAKTVGPQPNARRRGGAETITSLLGMLRQAPEQPPAQDRHQHAASVVHTHVRTPSPASPVAARAASPTPPTVKAPPRPQRPTVTFPMLVPARAPWDRAGWPNTVRWGTASIVAGVLIAIALLAWQLVQ